MNKKNPSAYITTALSIALIVVSAKNLIKTHRRQKAARSQIRTTGEADVAAIFRARDAVIRRIERGDYRNSSMDEIANAFADQIQFEKIVIQLEK